jgi:uncharacterized membrane protein YphA (DoxX/SURF4 family)
MRRIRLPPTDRLIRVAVILTILGLLLLVGILVTISALAVGLFMLGSLLITVSIALYLVAVIQELRHKKAI